MDNLLGAGDQNLVSAGGGSKLLRLDVNSPEYHHAQQERIEKRRQRIAAKIAKEKGADAESNKTPSSLEFLGVHNATNRGERKGDGKREGTRKSATAKGIRKDSESGDSQQAPEFVDPQMDTQLDDSRKQLEQIIIDGESLITNVKVAAEYREKVRHVRMDESRKERLQRLHDEANESQTMYNQITENWMNSAEKLLPLEFYTKIQEQQKACDELLEKQDEEIYNLRKELEDQDIEYENNLEMYQKDIMLMGDRIDDTADTLRTAFMEELELIEQYTVQDREQLLEENQKEFIDLLKEYDQMEKQSLEDRKNDALGKFDRLTDLYGNVKQEARLLKNQIQHDMRTLFMEREQIKCAIQLNLEKLDYNLAVLRKREEENMKMKNSMKRLLLKLQDRFNEKANSLHEKVAKGKRDSNRLITEIRRLESLCEDAKSKTLHIYASHYHKFMDLWELSEEDCLEKLCRLLGSERYIIEEQLGTKFVQPDLSRIEQRPREVQCHRDSRNCCRPHRSANSETTGMSESTLRLTRPQNVTSKLEGLKTAESKVAPSIASIFVLPSNMGLNQKSDPSLYVDPASDYEFCNTATPDADLLRNLMKHITNVICDQTGFLLEEKLRKLLATMVDSEKQLIHIDTVLQALNVTHIDQMQYLARYILKYSRIMKGIISRNDLAAPDPDRMMLSEDGTRQKDLVSASECDISGGGEKRNLERLREACDLDSTESEDGDERNTLSIHPSANELLSVTALENIKGITDVHGVPLTEPVSTAEIGTKPPTAATDNGKPGFDSSGSVTEIIQQFSSDESLAGVLRHVEQYGRQSKDTGDVSTSSCSCETVGEFSDSSTNNGTSLQQDDALATNNATVLSWVTEVAAGLRSDCKTRSDECLGEELHTVVNEVSEPAFFSKEPLRAETAILGDKEFESRSRITPVRSSCGPSDRSQIMTTVSPKSTTDSTEFFYVEPNDVLRALATFCRDHHAKIKINIPTKGDICDAKIAKMCLPNTDAVKEYWDRFVRLADPKSKFLWEGIQAVFAEYDANLKLRNQYVLEITKLYRQNYEVSHLLKKHIRQANQSCLSKNQIQPFDPYEMPYCGEDPRKNKNHFRGTAPHVSFPSAGRKPREVNTDADINLFE